MISDEHRKSLDECCDMLGVKLHEVLGKGRSVQDVVRARQAITWAMRERFPGLTWAKLAELMKRDHATLMYSASVFAKALHAGTDWAVAYAAELAGASAPLAGLESALDSLRGCAGIDLSNATDMPLEAVG
jgi:hypothetical protein